MPAIFAGLVAVGEFQINFTVPSGLATGTYPISIQVNGISSPTTINSNPPGQIVIAIQGSSSTTVSVNNSGRNVSNGRDNSFQIISDSTGQIKAPAAAFVVGAPGWGASIAGAAWIAPSADQGNDRQGCCSNTSDTYRTTVTISGSPTGVSLNFTIAADDYVDVYLNGAKVYTHASTVMWNSLFTFSITSGLVTGTNTLDFVVTNGGGPTGMAAISATTP